MLYYLVLDIIASFFSLISGQICMFRCPGFRGYLYINDDMVVNWWTFYNFNKEKLWLGAKVWIGGSHIMGKRPIRSDWQWWSRVTESAKSCENSYSEIIRNNRSCEYINVTKLIETHLANGKGVKRCFKTWSDFFYVPMKFSDQFQRISLIFYRNRVFLETAVPTIMSFLESRDSWEHQYGLYLPDKYGTINFADGKLVWKNYNYDIKFIHPVKFHGRMAKSNRDVLANVIVPYSKNFTKC